MQITYLVSESGSCCRVRPCNAMDYTVHGILQARILERAAFPSPGDLPNPGIEPSSPALQADSLPAEPRGKPKNTGVGSLSLLQWIFPTQELNPGLPHCRSILLPAELPGRGLVSSVHKELLQHNRKMQTIQSKNE